MQVTYKGRTNPTTKEGHKIIERTLYIYEVPTINDAIDCESRFQIPVRERNFFAQLKARGNLVCLEVPRYDDNLASFLLKLIETY